MCGSCVFLGSIKGYTKKSSKKTQGIGIREAVGEKKIQKFFCLIRLKRLLKLHFFSFILMGFHFFLFAAFQGVMRATPINNLIDNRKKMSMSITYNYV